MSLIKEMGHPYNIEYNDNRKHHIGNRSKLISKETTTKTMVISLDIFYKLQEFSRKNHNEPCSYDDLITELLDFWNSQNEPKYYGYSRI